MQNTKSTRKHKSNKREIKHLRKVQKRLCGFIDMWSDAYLAAQAKLDAIADLASSREAWS